MPNLDLRPAALNLLTYYKGNYAIRFTFTDGGDVYPLTDVTAASFVISEKNGTAALSLSSGSGLTVNGAGGYIDLALTNAQVVALFSQEYNFEFLLTLTGGVIWPIADGVFIVSEDGQTSVTDSDIILALENSTVEISVISPPSDGGSAGAAWGDITGTLADQTDLQTALDGKVDENAAITGATKTKITYDAKGLVTAGADATTADINDSTDRRYVTDAQQTVIGNTSGTNTGDQTITLTDDVTGSGTGSFAATIAADAVTNTKAANMAEWTVKGRNNAASGDPQDIGVADLTEEGSPAAGHMLFGWESGGTLRKFDIGNLPGGGGASYTEVTYAEMETLIGDSDLVPGGWYLITDASGTDLGFLTNAVTENTISVSGVGGYLNADFQAVGDYTGVEAITGIAAGTQRGLWNISLQEIQINYTNLAGGVFAVGDTITGDNTGATAVVTGGNGTSILACYMTSPGVAFDGSEVIDNGNGVTADMDGAPSAPQIENGDIVVWLNSHWQMTDTSATNGSSPENEFSGYVECRPEGGITVDTGGIEAWDISEFDFPNNIIIYRQDTRGNSVRFDQIAIDFFSNLMLTENTIQAFQWGRDDWYGNQINNAYFVESSSAIVNRCNLKPYVRFYANNCSAETTFQTLEMGEGSSIYLTTFTGECLIDSNVFYQFSQIESCSFINGNFLGNILYSNASIANSTFSGSVESCVLNGTSGISDCNISGEFKRATLMPGAGISEVETGQFCAIEDNILENGASLTGITAGGNCSISRNKIGQGATLGGGTTMGDGAEFNDLDIRANKQISNKELDDSVTFSDKIVHLTTDEAETCSANVEGNRTQPGFSDIPGTIDIEGLTTLDYTLAFAQYRGILTLTSGNGAENIDQIDNPPLNFPFTLRPAPGLVLTVTGTAYSGIAAGQIALKASDYVLDGDKGEYIVLEVDPLGTGCLIEKLVVNGLI